MMVVSGIYEEPYVLCQVETTMSVITIRVRQSQNYFFLQSFEWMIEIILYKKLLPQF